MPKPSDYTPARRRTMQIVMIGLLLATVALAAIVSEASRRANRIELSPDQHTVDHISVRLPAGWRVRPRGDDPRTVVHASDVSTGHSGRILTVICEPLETPLSPSQYLATLVGSDGPVEAQQMTTPVAGHWGVIAVTQSIGHGIQEHEIYACAVLPSLRAVVVHLRATDGSAAVDLGLVRQVAAAIEVAHEPSLGRPDERVTLPEGIEVRTPAAFVPVAQTDPNRTDRLLWPASALTGQSGSATKGWVTLELVGCVIPVSIQPPEKLVESILLSRDSAWRGAAVSRARENVWTVHSAAPSGTSAYFIAGDGLGLLAILRGPGPTPIDVEQLVSATTFTKTLDAAQLEAVGSAEAARLRSIGFEALIGVRDEQWWIWTAPGQRPHRGWTHVLLRPDALRGSNETRLRQHPAHLMRLVEQFSQRDAVKKYHSELTRTDLVDDATLTTQSITSIADGQLTTITVGPGEAGEKDARPLPPQYVPGALLPLVLGQLHGGPMLLQSDSFPGAGGPPGGLLTLLISESRPTTRTAAGDDAPMRGVVVQVNGSGRLSRWYFRQTGELECVEFDRGLQRLPADQNSIRFAFGSDPSMMP